VVVTPALITKKAIRYCREITGGSRYAWFEFSSDSHAFLLSFVCLFVFFFGHC
jgi:hypothetical protein